jgi:hypothetical protein
MRTLRYVVSGNRTQFAQLRFIVQLCTLPLCAVSVQGLYYGVELRR